MKKIININLSGRVIPIEDTAYDSLQRYIESLRRYFANEEGRDEIINDIESRIAELMNDKIKKGATSITDEDMEAIITSMGRVEDFEQVDGEPATAASAGSSAGSTGGAGHSYQDTGRSRFTGRLYRDADDKIIGGVCAGIANYMNVDPAIVRLVFAVITFGGFGFGILLYILAWIILPSRTLNNYVGKRFFRNPDDKIIGGVAGGIGAYFNKPAWAIRLIFAAPLLLNILVGVLNGIFSVYHRDIFPNLFVGSFTGTFILTYIILWIVLPEAKTPYEKMEMRGEKVDINTIRQNVKEGMSTFKDRMQAWGEEVKTVGQNMSDRAREFSRTQGADLAQDFRRSAKPVGQGIGHAIGVVFKAFFLFIAGIIAFSLFVALLVFTFGGLSQPVNAFLIDGTSQKMLMWGTLILFFAVPIIGIIIWIIRRVMNVRSQNRYLGWTFGGLWTLGWVAAMLFAASLVKDFRITERSESTVQLAQANMSKLVVQVPGSPIRYSGSFSWINADDEQGWDITEDSLRLSNVRINVKQSEDSFYHVNLIRYSHGNSARTALQRAEDINYNVSSSGTVLSLGSGFSLGSHSKFRNQRVLVEIRVPVGRQIRFDHSVGDKLNPYNIRVGEVETWNRKRSWSRRNYEYDWDNNYYYDWEPDTDYYMSADGKLRKVGDIELTTPPTERDENEIKDSLLREYKRQLDSSKTTNQNDNTELTREESGTVFTKKNDIGGDVLTPVPMPFVPTIF